MRRNIDNTQMTRFPLVISKAFVLESEWHIVTSMGLELYEKAILQQIPFDGSTDHGTFIYDLFSFVCCLPLHKYLLMINDSSQVINNPITNILTKLSRFVDSFVRLYQDGCDVIGQGHGLTYKVFCGMYKVVERRR